jgi:uracil-DNA glycosylase
LELLSPSLRSVVVLGAFGWQAVLSAFAEAGWTVPRPRPVFGHGARVRLERPGVSGGSGGAGGSGGPGGSIDVFGCFHVSQRNTFTGRLTPAMLREVLRTAARAAGLPTAPPMEDSAG